MWCIGYPNAFGPGRGERLCAPADRWLGGVPKGAYQVQGLGAFTAQQRTTATGAALLLAAALALSYWSERDGNINDPVLWAGVAGLGLAGLVALRSKGPT